MVLDPSRIRLAAVVGHVIFLLGIVSWIISKGQFGVDFAVFHLGGRSLRADGYDAVYDSAIFQAELARDYVPGLLDNGPSATSFISTPPFAWIMQPVSMIPFDVALWLWLAIGGVAVWGSVRWLGLGNRAALLAFVSPAFINNLGFGQSAPFVLLAGVAVHKMVEADRKFAAGLIGGLLIIKPTIAIGLGLWWLMDIRRWYRAVAGAALSASVVVLPTVAGGFGPWRSFADAMTQRVDVEGDFQQFSPSVPEFLKLLAPGASGTLTLIFWIVAAAAAAVLVSMALRTWSDDAAVLSAAAAVATVVASPHLLVYDTLLLIIPLAVAVNRGVLTTARTELLLAIFTCGLALGPLFYSLQFDLIGRGVGLEMPTFVLCIALMVRWMVETPTIEERALTPVVANR